MRLGCGNISIPGTGSQVYSPLVLGSRLNFWFRPDLGVNLIGGAVGGWTDQGFHSRNVTQGVIANRPGLVASDPAYGGVSTLSFDGNDFLDSAVFGAPLPQPSTIVCVGNTVDDVDFYSFLDATTAGDRNVLQSAAGALGTRVFAGVILTAPVLLSSPSVMMVEFDGINSSLRVNRFSSTDVVGDAGGQSLPSLRIGLDIGVSGLVGSIAEVIGVDGILSADERVALLQYASARTHIVMAP